MDYSLCMHASWCDICTPAIMCVCVCDVDTSTGMKLDIQLLNRIDLIEILICHMKRAEVCYIPTVLSYMCPCN